MSQILNPKKGYKLETWYFGKEIEIPKEWTIKKFHKICSVPNGQVDPKETPYRDMKHVGQRNIEKFTGKLLEVRTASEDGQISGKYIFDKNHILYGKINPNFAKVAFPKFDGICSADMYPIKCKNEQIIPEFLFYCILSTWFTHYAMSVSDRTGIPKINRNELDNAKFILPSISEQQKIASILSRVDALIESTQKIIEKTERLKKGMMQKLLTRGIGHDKFKKVKWNYGKLLEIPKTWDIVLLDTVAQRGSGHTPDIKKPEFYNGGIKWISLADSNRLDNIHISETTKEISQKGIENSSAVIHPSGVVVLSRDAGVGKSAITKTEMAVSQHFMVWQCGEHLNNYFLYYLLQFWKSLFESIAIGTTIPTIGLSFFKKFRIIFPQKIEQDKIANILSNVDSQIQSQTQYKEKLERLKKSLMQKLLTGQIRVKV